MKTRILIVDDDLRRSGMLDKVLREAGYAVRAAARKSEAAGWLQADRSELLLLDLDLLEESGFDVLDMAVEFPSLRVVVLTGHLHELESTAFLGADAVLEKPAEAQQLLGTLEMLMDEPAKERLKRRANGPRGIRFISSLRQSRNRVVHGLDRNREQRPGGARI